MVTKISLWLLAFTPLVVDFKVFSPYTSGKNLLIETCLVLAVILLLINFFYSRAFKEEITGKVLKYIRQPLFLAVLAFVFVSIISTIFAVDKYSAFWGELSRAEGLVGLVFFFSFFVFTLLIFEKKDWLWFFKLSLFVSLILIGKEFIEFFSGIARPGSYTGNPTFLAGYLLFSITSALIVIDVPFEIARARSVSPFQTGWRYLSVIVIILSIFGIFIAQTRGTILGLSLGIIAVLIYGAFKGKDINYKIFNLRKLSIVFLCLGIIFFGVFLITRKSEVWQKVPGLSRLAITNTGDEEDPSTQIRLFVYKSSLQSVNPVQGNLGRLLIGWGPDNFLLADSKYYYAEQYKYEQRWYDRAHNKFLDTLVMTGIFGLLAYLSILFLLFKSILKRKEFLLTDVGLFMFSISYFIHLMFVFDQISTSLSFFAILAFITYLTAVDPVLESKKPQITPELREKGEIITGSFLVLLIVFLSFVYFKSTLPGYIQMRNYFSEVRNLDVVVLNKINTSIFDPFTPVQVEIRRNFLNIMADNYIKNHDQISEKNFIFALTKEEEFVKKRPYELLSLSMLADAYNNIGFAFNNNEYLQNGEKTFRKIYNFAPKRADINYGLAINLFYQNRYEESFAYFESLFILNSNHFDNDQESFEGIYTRFMKYFYEQKDKENFVKVVNRLKENNYADLSSLNKILDYLSKNGVWPRVNFE
jgi:O-antigen ligase